MRRMLHVATVATVAASLIAALTATASRALARSGAVEPRVTRDADARNVTGDDRAAARQCAALAAHRFGDARIDAASYVVPAPRWSTPSDRGAPASVTTEFCRVEGRIAGRIGFEAWLPPPSRWNGRLLGAGVGGDAGVYNYRDLARGLAAGFAAVTNDSGHKASEPRWMLRRAAVLDYTHRSQHLMNVAARRVVAAFYGSGPHHAYFIGCSGGGRQALKEIQRFPADYDGVVAGAPAPAMPEMSARHLFHALHEQANPDAALDDAQWSLVARAAVAACDADDGVVDGVVERPLECRFDPASLRCGAGESRECLDKARIATVRRFYAPLRDERGTQRDSGLVPGVRTRPGPASPLLVAMFALGAHRDPEWDPRSFVMSEDLALVERRMPELRADDPDLRAFARRGGRAILYQGWLDPSVAARNTLDWFEAVRRTSGTQVADETLRLYMVPGLLHCQGGDGVQHFGGSADPLPVGDATHDMLAALVDWVERGVAPGAIVATRIDDGRVTRRRRLCPWPSHARYRGGPGEDPASYECAPPRAGPPPRARTDTVDSR